VEFDSDAGREPHTDLQPAAVDKEVLRRAGSAIVGREKEDHLHKFVGIDAALQCLGFQRARLALGAPPWGPNVSASVRVIPSTPDLAMAYPGKKSSLRI